MRFLSVAILCAVAANLLAQEKPAEGQPVKKAQVPAEGTRVDRGPEKPAEGTRVDRPHPARQGHYTIHITWAVEGELPPLMPSPGEGAKVIREPQKVAEGGLVSSNPDSPDYIPMKIEQLKILLRTLKARGAKMEGHIEFPEVKGRHEVLDLDKDVKVEVPKEGEKVRK